MKVLVCGGRDFTNTRKLYQALDSLKPDAIIQGGAAGADSIADLYAIERGLPAIEVKANWGYYDKAAGPIRNKWMLDFCSPDLVLAFPTERSRGTWDMVRQAKKAKVGVKVID